MLQRVHSFLNALVSFSKFSFIIFYIVHFSKIGALRKKARIFSVRGILLINLWLTKENSNDKWKQIELNGIGSIVRLIHRFMKSQTKDNHYNWFLWKFLLCTWYLRHSVIKNFGPTSIWILRYAVVHSYSVFYLDVFKISIMFSDQQ